MCQDGSAVEEGGEACLLIRKQDHFTPTREIRRHVRALARNHPEGWKFRGPAADFEFRWSGLDLGFESGSEVGTQDRFRADSEQSRKSRPDSGLGLRHFSGKGPPKL